MFTVPEITDFDFFEKVRRGEMTKLEILEFIRIRTGDDPEKAEVMKGDFNSHMETYEVLTHKRKDNAPWFTGTLSTIINKAQKQITDASTISVSSIEHLFYDKTSYKECVNLLKEATPCVIDGNHNYCLGLRSKAAVVAWVDCMKNTNKMKKNIADKIMAEILNKTFTGLNINERTLRSNGTQESSVYKKYYKQF